MEERDREEGGKGNKPSILFALSNDFVKSWVFSESSQDLLSQGETKQNKTKQNKAERNFKRN